MYNLKVYNMNYEATIVRDYIVAKTLIKDAEMHLLFRCFALGRAIFWVLHVLLLLVFLFIKCNLEELFTLILLLPPVFHSKSLFAYLSLSYNDNNASLYSVPILKCFFETLYVWHFTTNEHYLHKYFKPTHFTNTSIAFGVFGLRCIDVLVGCCIQCHTQKYCL